MALSVIVMIDM